MLKYTYALKGTATVTGFHLPEEVHMAPVHLSLSFQPANIFKNMKNLIFKKHIIKTSTIFTFLSLTPIYLEYMKNSQWIIIETSSHMYNETN